MAAQRKHFTAGEPELHYSAARSQRGADAGTECQRLRAVGRLSAGRDTHARICGIAINQQYMCTAHERQQRTPRQHE